METVVKQFNELTLSELYEIMKLRVDVFVVEQKCPYHELDNLDQNAIHVFLKDDEGIEAYLRVMDKGVVFEDAAAIGRVIARKRRCHLGSELLQAGINTAEQYYHTDLIRLEAQVYARSFYEKAGFVQCSEPFLEDGIPHVQMVRKKQ
ncbi:MAG: GNAT family N-acetyltransferase [Solobacterium sp.]|jgi:ElaA protein|nr:GNAT family N-acetyltransferase [Solobacterium sp.]MCH4222126.1 GNAT family N-acetyltransferase [Solobacterium sp.]MCH4265887.1 GNAT family N-acetyltransferase [Solobacterium sp.]